MSSTALFDHVCTLEGTSIDSFDVKSGQGCFITPSLVLTAWHCVSGASVESVVCRTTDGAQAGLNRFGESLLVDEGSDLALLALSRPIGPVALPEVKSEDNDELMVLTRGKGFSQIYKAWRVPDDDLDESLFLSEFKLGPGHSGAPVFNARRELVSVVTHGWVGGDVETVLKSVKATQRLRHHFSGAAQWRVDNLLRNSPHLPTHKSRPQRGGF